MKSTLLCPWRVATITKPGKQHHECKNSHCSPFLLTILPWVVWHTISSAWNRWARRPVGFILPWPVAFWCLELFWRPNQIPWSTVWTLLHSLFIRDTRSSWNNIYSKIFLSVCPLQNPCLVNISLALYDSYYTSRNIQILADWITESNIVSHISHFSWGDISRTSQSPDIPQDPTIVHSRKTWIHEQCLWNPSFHANRMTEIKKKKRKL